MNRRMFFGLFALPFVARTAPPNRVEWDPLWDALHEMKKSRAQSRVVEFWYAGPDAAGVKKRVEAAWNRYVAEHPLRESDF